MTDLILGQKIKDFKFQSTEGRSHQLSDFKGKHIVLYFYPKDNTPGCTQEGKDFRDHYEKFMQLNTVIFGISRDSLESHQKFKTKQCFPFELISDKDETLCDYFDVLKPIAFFGKKIRSIQRSTFLIDGNGVLRHVWRKVKVKGHVEEVLEIIKHLSD